MKIGHLSAIRKYRIFEAIRLFGYHKVETRQFEEADLEPEWQLDAPGRAVIAWRDRASPKKM